MLRDRPKLGESYVPQLGDEVVYVPHGHHAFLEHSVNKAADRPWLSLGAPGEIVGGNGTLYGDDLGGACSGLF